MKNYLKMINYKVLILIIGILSMSNLYASQPLLIAIAGGSGAGKTTFANKLADAIGDDVVIINQDSYYRDLSHLTPKEKEKVNYDHPDAIDFELLSVHLQQLKKGKSIEMPDYDFITSSRKKTTKVSPKRVILIEGILLLAVPEVREKFDIKLFIDVDDDIRVLRRALRDTKDRGLTITEVNNQYIETVKPMHWQFIEPSKKYADVMIHQGGANRVAFDLILSKIKLL